MRSFLSIASMSLLLSSGCRFDHRSDVQWTGEVTDKAVVWQGFIQDWGYNHRLNSLGDFVGPLDCDGDECEVELVHSAASGSGRDTANYTTWATAVSAPGVRFLQGSFSFELDFEEAEGELITENARLVLDLDEQLQGLDQYHLVLGGFDIFARRDADKLEHLTIDLAAPRSNEDRTKLMIEGDLEVLLDCDSLECDGAFRKGDRSVRYRVVVPWLLIAGNDGDLALTEQELSTAYAWEDGRGAELQLEDVRASGTITGRVPRTDTVQDRTYSTALPVMTALSVDLDDDHHMAGWASRVKLDSYDASTGDARVSMDLMFKQWNQGTRDFVLSYTDAGSAENVSRVGLLQLRQACTSEVTADGSITWEADGRPADSDDAVSSMPAAVAGSCAG